MSSPALITRRLRALLSTDVKDDGVVDDIVLLDSLDEDLRAGKTPTISNGQRMRLNALLHSDEMAWMYFLVAEGQGGAVIKVKVGMTPNPDRCIGRFRAMSPLPIREAALIRCPAGYEPMLQRALGKWHDHHEWFMPSPEVLGLANDVKQRRFRAVHEFVLSTLAQLPR